MIFDWQGKALVVTTFLPKKKKKKVLLSIEDKEDYEQILIRIGVVNWFCEFVFIFSVIIW